MNDTLIIDKKQKWYAIYTKPRSEKKTNQRLIEKGIETYLPLIKVLRQWSDRKKWVEVTLFSSYLFVKIEDKDYLKVLQTGGVVMFISFENKRIPIPNKQIETIKCLITNNINFEVSNEQYKIGDMVEIQSGAMIGIRGALLQLHGKHKVIIKMEAINQSLLVEIPINNLTKVS